MNTLVHRITKVIVDFMFYAGMLACLAVPFVLAIWHVELDVSGEDVMPLAAVLIASGVAAVYIMWQLKVIFKTLLGGNPFVKENITCLRKISVACFVIMLVYVAKCVFMFTIATLLLVIAFGVVGLFCLTLKDMFKLAVFYKEETDYTV